MSLEREIHSLVDEMLGDDARQALAAYRRFTTEHLPWLERRAVLAGRRRGDSWAMIGRLLGRSRQSVQQRFDRAFTIAELRAPSPLASDAEEAHRFYANVLQHITRQQQADEAADANGLVPW